MAVYDDDMGGGKTPKTERGLEIWGIAAIVAVCKAWSACVLFRFVFDFFLIFLIFFLIIDSFL
jgi:hypothetical protein